jgi:hypothetical protein
MVDLGRLGSLVVAPQITTQVGLNLAALSPGTSQVLAQQAGSGVAVAQQSPSHPHTHRPPRPTVCRPVKSNPGRPS